ncbi:DNA/RNA non-specific endonuclease [Glutamicibacter arilaitensis]|uniref:DNA/RNA non-specific endonuclease n=1 Tax=Glutamicibacter arilaitensis TaxID=256701 RepID=UPI001867F559|nr:DNA/RNA non-specific endonuclease [Glutamicibacter arilaitensis]
MKVVFSLSTDADLPNASIDRIGYDPEFLRTSVTLPVLDAEALQDAVLWEGSNVIPYTHFSLSLSKSRRLARWVAWNIDGAAIKRLSRSGLEFGKDLRLPEEFQSGNELYQGNRLDRGHIARRADLVWGEAAQAQQANEDSFFYTNIAPQMDDFNQSSQEGVWGQLENALYEQVDVEDLKVSVFGGPVFQPGDQVYRGVGLPSEYWKLIVFKEGGVLKARAFLLTQDLDQLRVALALDEFRVYQVSVGELEQRTDLEFAESVRLADDLVAIRAKARVPLSVIADIEW